MYENVNKLNLIRLLGRGGWSQLCRGSAWTTRASLALYGGAGRGGNLQRKNTRASPPRGLCTCTFQRFEARSHRACAKSENYPTICTTRAQDPSVPNTLVPCLFLAATRASTATYSHQKFRCTLQKKKKKKGGGFRKNEKKTYNFVELKNEHQYNLNKLLITSGFFSPSFFSSSFL